MAMISYKIENYIAYITINRSEVLNCFNYEALSELQNVVDGSNTAENVHIVIFTGAGDKAFSAGADLKERKTLNDQEVRRNVKAIRDVFNSIASYLSRRLQQ